MKIIFIFGGTGNTAEEMSGIIESLTFSENVVRIYFNGCHDPEIGGRILGVGYIDPNLDTVAEKLRECFTDGGTLMLQRLNEEFNQSIRIFGNTPSQMVVDDIILSGRSRGGVECFSVARHLDDLGKPISLFSLEPVPGDSMQFAKQNDSEFLKNSDLSKCQNLVHAEIALGVYDKHVLSFHNKYFRQMVPILPDSCKTSIYKVPKSNHFIPNAFLLNHETDFFEQQGVLSKRIHYSEADSEQFLVPKIVQQKIHGAHIESIALSTRYKKRLSKAVYYDLKEIHRKSSVKIGQALRALDAADLAEFHPLSQEVINNTSNDGKALREFLVEFETINHFIFKTLSSDKKQKLVSEFNAYRVAVYDLVQNYFHQDHVTFQQTQIFQHAMLDALQSFKDGLPSKIYTEFQQLTQLFLQDNVLFYPDLTQYIDETECFNTKTSNLAQEKIPAEQMTTASELAESLYFMSQRSRDRVYHKLNLSQVVKNAHDLVDVIRFFSSAKVGDVLKSRKMKGLMKNMDDINHVMAKLFTYDQRKEVYHAVKRSVFNFRPTFHQLGEFTQFLSLKKNISLLEELSFERMTYDDFMDLHDLYDQFSDDQRPILMPIVIKKLGDYCTKTGQDFDCVLSSSGVLSSNQLDESNTTRNLGQR
ncbi:MAG: hypothetical protein Q8R24_01460 [Legionellaceae bacterium]|nr:hypothetical protein [Legionellaceae bacterium]